METMSTIIKLLFALDAILLFCFAVLIFLQRAQNKKMRLLQEGMEEQKKALAQMSEALSFALRRLSEETPTHADMQQARETQNALWRELLSARAQEEAQRLDTLTLRLDAMDERQETRLHRISANMEEKLNQNEQRMERVRETLRQSVSALQEENSKKLEEMRVTVDEKLHATLDKRLGESFSMVSQRLEQVYRGLGEMQTLASGVGDLKKVLSNVKTRGVWGEMQLGALLAQVLSPNQYDENVAVVPGASQRVEFAVKLPGQGVDMLYLPIDSKFPLEDYERLLSALDSGDAAAVSEAERALQLALRVEAKRIAGKYIAPPHTTDFAIMFLPVEGLYAEALRARGLVEELQEKHRIVLAGPTTLNALLTSLQVGFRTLAIEQRTDEIWQLLGAVKTEFGTFTRLLDATKKKMNAVTESIETASRKSRTIERKLRRVEALEDTQATLLLEEEDTLSLPNETE